MPPYEIEKDAAPVFFASPIGDEGSAARQQSDVVQKLLIEPAAQEAEFTQGVQRNDESVRGGWIPPGIVEQILASPLVVVDLSSMNPNVMYELGLVHAYKKPFVLLVDKTTVEDVAFDVKQLRYLEYDYDYIDRLVELRQSVAALMRDAHQEPARLITGVTMVDAPEPGGADAEAVERALSDALRQEISALTLEIRAHRKQHEVMPIMDFNRGIAFGGVQSAPPGGVLSAFDPPGTLTVTSGGLGQS